MGLLERLFEEPPRRRREWLESCWAVKRAWRGWCGIYKNLDRLEILGRGGKDKDGVFMRKRGLENVCFGISASESRTCTSRYS